MNERFEEIAALEADWDGEGADKPSAAAIANARRFVEALAKLGEPVVGVCSDGSVDLWWSPGSDGDTVLINFKDARASFYSMIGGMTFKGSAFNGGASRD